MHGRDRSELTLVSRADRRLRARSPVLLDHSTWRDRATWPMRAVSSMRHDRLGDAGLPV